METKICKCCNIEKEYIYYHKNKSRKDGISVYCKDCTNEQKRKGGIYHHHEIKNAEKKKGVEKYKIYNNEYIKKWNKEHRKKLNKYDAEYRKKRLKNDELYKLKLTIRKSILSSFKRMNWSKSSKTQHMLGCDWETFKIYMENQFKEGMTWENHGDWHYDHIIPICEAKNEEDLIKLNHYTNFQPLWAQENLKKSNKIWT